ncbi:MAG: TVP38/TMEM64 family protein [Thermodesulfobacteriota bacterium]
MNWKKLVVLVGLATLAAAFFVLDLGRFFTLEYAKASQARFAALYAEHAVAVIAGYFALYVAVTALSLPVATVVSLAGGALFGFWVGLAVVSFASTAGAALACAASRFVLRDWVARRFGDRLAAIDRGIEREGAFYLFTLRLVPAFPFFLINLALGLTPMRLTTFSWVSQLGMLPGAMVYVNAGRELGRLDSLSGILSPSLLASFALLGLFPLAARRIVRYFRARSGRAGGEP